MIKQKYTSIGGSNYDKFQEIYHSVFKEYPDVLDVKQVGKLLGVSTKTVYSLLREGTIDSLKIGREFRIPKVNVMRYVRVLNTSISNEERA